MGGARVMMVVIFLAMLAALGLAWLDRPVFAWLAGAGCLALVVWLFLWEIRSPEYGFRMPWIDTRLDTGASGGAAG